jgi:hypothetical protein
VLNLNNKEKILFYSVSAIILLFFSSIFILSTFKIVNAWSYSQAYANYFDGYVRRGLFGTLMIFIEKNLNIDGKLSFSLFFIILTTTYIVIFLLLIKKYIHNYLLFFFLAFNPTLILFQFNDLGGYQRFDSISIFLILYHSLNVHNYNSGLITLKSYTRKLYYIILPIFFFSLFIHEIQSWSLIFHLVLTLNIFKNNYKKIIFIYSLFLIPITFIFVFPVNNMIIDNMINNLNNKNLYFDAIRFAASTKSNLSIIEYEFKTNVLNLYNFKINLFFITMATMPFYLFLIFLKKNLYLFENNLNFKYLVLAHLPFLTLFLIGDTGRWINLMSFVSLGYMAQFSIKKKISNYGLNKINFNNLLIYVFICIIIFIYSFFIRMPHCCDLEKKKINIWGGISSKIIAYIKILKKDDHPDFNLNLRFKL